MTIAPDDLNRRSWISPEDREALARVLDVILPGTNLQPSGRAAHAHEDLLDRVVAADPRLIEPLRNLAAQAADAKNITLVDIEKWAAEHTNEVVFGLMAAYYMSGEVRGLIGYPGQRRLPIAQATPDQTVSDDLVAPVRSRGPIYVPTPGV